MVHMKVIRLSQIIWAAVLTGIIILTVVFGVMLWRKNTGSVSPKADASVQTDAAEDKPPVYYAKEKVALLLSDQAIPVTAEGNFPDAPDVIEKVIVEKAEPIIESTDKPKSVLIYHTHDTESYRMESKGEYEESDPYRTEDDRYNIVAVGEELAKLLREKGIEVIHDTTGHEQPKLGTAYVRSLETLQSYDTENFDLIIDLHRDAASTRNTNPSTVEFDEKTCARLMLLIGNGNNFSTDHPWKENYALAEAITEELNTVCPGICREVMVKDGRYNQHLSTKCVLIEVGHNENTLKEALNTCEPLAITLEKILCG